MTTRSLPVLSTVLVCLLSFSTFGCQKGDDPAEDNLMSNVEMPFKIKDHKLRSDIKWELSIPSDTPITAEDMLKLTELDAEVSPPGFLDVLFDSPPKKPFPLWLDLNTQRT